MSATMVLVLLLCNFLAAEAAIITTASTQVVDRDAATTVTVPCITDGDGTQPYWIARNLILYNGKVIKPDKYEVSAEASQTGNYSLVIKNLQRSDSGNYTCQQDSATIIIKLIVADRPGPARIVAQNGVLIENDTFTFNCTSKDGFPIPTFTWTRGQDVIQQTTSFTEGETTISQLAFKLSNTDNGKQLRCVAQNILGQSNEGSLTLNVQHVPRVRITPSNLIVLKDTSFSLNCEFTANPEPTSIEWYKNEERISGATVETLTQTSLLEDALFRCKVTNNRGSRESTTQVIVHYEPKVFINEGESTFVDKDGKLELTCNVDSQPQANVEWRKDGAAISSTPILTINSVKETHQGTYTCKATNTLSPTNGAGGERTAEASIVVDVRYPPGKPKLIVTSEGDNGIHTAEKDTAHLACVLSKNEIGNPRANFSWYKGDSLIGTGQNYSINPSAVTNTGEYRCRVENALGSEDSDHITLIFQDVPVMLSSFPQGPTVNFSRFATNARLECVFKGFPRPNIQWYRASTPLNNKYAQYEIQTQHEDIAEEAPYVKVKSELLFRGSARQGVDVFDMNSFRCEASNDAGPASDQFNVKVNVLFAPLTRGYGKVASDIGSSVTIPCNIESYPAVFSVVFKRNGKEVVSEGDIKVGQLNTNVDGFEHKQKMEMTISSVDNEDYGDYQCICQNAIGTTEHSITLEKSGRPDAPSNLSVEATTWNSVTLNWQPGFDGGEDQGFTVSQNTDLHIIKDFKGSEYTANNLMPAAVYKFKVFATNSLGRSEASNEVTVTTQQLYIPVPTVDLAKGGSSLTVSLNSSDFCVYILGSNEQSDYKTIHSLDCVRVNYTATVPLLANSYKYYVAKACVLDRTEVCSPISPEPVAIEGKNDDPDMVAIIIGVVVSLVVILVIIVVVAIYCTWRKKSASRPQKKQGHINPIMTNTSVHLQEEMNFKPSGHHRNNLNVADEDLDDPVHYGDVRDGGALGQSSPNQNLDSIYASVQKRSEVDKMNSIAYADQYEMQNHTNRSEISDETDLADRYEVDSNAFAPGVDMIGNYAPNNLSMIVGNNSPPYNRFPSVSESGYSTPDSKALKKVIYEVIV